jgi:hypothetical protein
VFEQRVANLSRALLEHNLKNSLLAGAALEAWECAMENGLSFYAPPGYERMSK